MAGLGAPELIIVLVVVLVLFGGSKLPKLARSLGEAQSEFKKGTDGDAAEPVVVVDREDAAAAASVNGRPVVVADDAPNPR
ncbi:MAG: twin-arginine translocase TatA/TatE family subunit [Acidimicrobiia bacterium]|nr:twin-arginine translocase TatA/TatE family subunit [Acidimicrobiia bacterium]